MNGTIGLYLTLIRNEDRFMAQFLMKSRSHKKGELDPYNFRDFYAQYIRKSRRRREGNLKSLQTAIFLFSKNEGQKLARIEELLEG